MPRFWLLLLWAGISTALPVFRTSSVSYNEAIRSAVKLYNEMGGNKFSYRLLRAEARPDWDSCREGPQTLTFSIKETNCVATNGRDFSRCNFREHGAVKHCSGSYTSEKKPLVNQVYVVCNW